MSRLIWGLFLVVNFMQWVLSKFSESLLASNHLFKDSNTIFMSFLKFSDLELVNILLVLSVN
jgi:hypothetical protein